MTTKRTPGRNGPEPRPGALTARTTKQKAAGAKRSASSDDPVAVGDAMLLAALPTAYLGLIDIYGGRIRKRLRGFSASEWLVGPSFAYQRLSPQGVGRYERLHVYEMRTPWDGANKRRLTVVEWLDEVAPDMKAIATRAEQYAIAALAVQQLFVAPDPNLAVLFPVRLPFTADPRLCVAFTIGHDRQVIVSDVPLGNFMPASAAFHDEHGWTNL